MTPIEVAEQIQKKIELLEKARKRIKPLAERKAKSIAEYRKGLAIVTMRLKNGDVIELGDQLISNPPATIIGTIAHGYCWELKLEADEAEAMYKGLITTIGCIKAELNAWQSINRYLDNV